MSKMKITKQTREFLSNPRLSAKARVLYLLLSDRAALNSKNADKFSDEHGIFVYYPLSEISNVLGCSEQTAANALVELSDAGLIERRHGQSADRIYIL
ncbi:MAG: replication initiator protein A [Clostridia bacterium]|nr:replication initiator protein A [Clostridia bacterium]